MNNNEKFTGTFNEIAIEFTAADLGTDKMFDIVPLDMREEVVKALTYESCIEHRVFYASHTYDNQTESTRFILFPNAQRGGICQSGYTEWFDVCTLDELEDILLNQGIEDPTDEQMASFYGYGDGGRSAEDQPWHEVK